ncbi:MAG TPA: metallophosphoesterase [Flavisolibacter sp.]|nr:metallophosphoesterase [Flavisolibacter sp.]
MIIVDLYVFQIIKFLTHSASPKIRSIISITYWVISISALLILFLLPYLNLDNIHRSVRSTVFSIFIGLFLGKLIASVFFLVDDIRRGIQWISGQLFFKNTEVEVGQTPGKISRSLFLSWLGVGLGSTLYGSLIYGFSNKYNYQVQRIPVSFPNLPDSFKGLRMVQISDIHVGSFMNRAAVQKGVEKIMSLKPDLIVFTGDLVNNEAKEMSGYIDVFNKLKAPLGVYSIFGNHDYGDYVKWENLQQKKENLDELKRIHAQMGWRLLLDEHVAIEKEGASFALIGIQNWSALKRFPRYGNLQKAYAGTEEYPFKVLLSHDPTHWDAEVRTAFNDIDLTLSGHTHGMQFGVELPFFKWSPVEYVYDQWAGLYSEGRQKLYVNRGYGFIGYPGRVGILPEITLFEFDKA